MNELGEIARGVRVSMIARMQREIERLTAENERLRAAFIDATRLLTLEQIQQLPEKSVRALADMGLLVHQQTITLSEPTPEQEAYLRQIEEASNWKRE